MLDYICQLIFAIKNIQYFNKIEYDDDYLRSDKFKEENL